MSEHTQKVALASSIGQTIEWYDFFIYGTASALVFGELFFPSHDPLVGTLLSFATFGVAFVARPLGGVLFGHFGDKVGRKPMLVTTLIIMGIASGVVGLLPTYATLGIGAPIILTVLRILQGLSVGGEYGGAVLMCVEHAAENRRGFFGSWVQAGSPAGLILANGVFVLMTTQVSHDAFLDWAWRVPFLFSFALVAVGIVIRLRLEESPAFQEAVTTRKVNTAPLVTVLRTRKTQVLLTAGAYICVGVTIYTAAVFGLSYGTDELGFGYTEMLLMVLIGQVLAFVLMPLFGRMSDRVGHKRVCMVGTAGCAILAFPWLWLFNTGSFWVALAGFFLLFIPYSATYGTMAAFFAEAYETTIGYSGLSMGYQLGTVIGSGLAPIIAISLFAATGTIAAVGGYIVLTGVVSLACAAGLMRVPTRPPDPHQSLHANRQAIT